MKHITKFLLFLLLPAALTFQACDKEIADTTAATDEKNVAADTSQSMVSILAGTTFGYKDGPALQAQFSLIADIAVADDGTVYIVEQTRIRKLKDGTVSTVAGSATSGCKDGPAKSALFGRLTGIDIAADGSVYAIDNGNNSIRKITTNGIVSTFAGGADKKGYKDGPLQTAKFDDLQSIAFGTDDIMYIGEVRSLRKIAPDGIVSTIVKPDIAPENDPTYRVTIIERITTSADGSLYYVSTIGSGATYINKIPGGTIYEGGGIGTEGLAAAPDGTVYMIYGPASWIARLESTEPDGNIVIAGIGGGLFENPNGPEEGPALKVYFGGPNELDWFDNALYVADGFKIKKVTLP